MRVDPQSAPPEAVRASAARAVEATPAGSFAASLARVSKSTEAAAAQTTRGAAESARAAGTSASNATAAAFAIPRNERYQPVEGKQYEEIVSGPRNGMFINRSGNSRDGDAFVLVKRGDRVFHVYGKGDRREVVAMGRAQDDKPAVEEKYRDVPGRAFERIVEGRREGLYVNRSGNARDGEAFRLVTRGERELHIYGSGRDRLVVSILMPEHRRERDGADKVASDPAPKAAPVGGGQA